MSRREVALVMHARSGKARYQRSKLFIDPVEAAQDIEGVIRRDQ